MENKSGKYSEVIMIAGKNIESIMKRVVTNIKEKDSDDVYNFMEINDLIMVHLKETVDLKITYVETDKHGFGNTIGVKHAPLAKVEMTTKVMGDLIQGDNLGIIHIENGVFDFIEYNDKKTEELKEELEEKGGGIYLGYKNDDTKLLIGDADYSSNAVKLWRWLESVPTADEDEIVDEAEGETEDIAEDKNVDDEPYRDVYLELIHPDNRREQIIYKNMYMDKESVRLGALVYDTNQNIQINGDIKITLIQKFGSEKDEPVIEKAMSTFMGDKGLIAVTVTNHLDSDGRPLVNNYGNPNPNYQKYDFVSFEAIHGDDVNPDDIKWAYTFIDTKSSIQQVLNGISPFYLAPVEESEKEFEFIARCKNNAKIYILKDKSGRQATGKMVDDYVLKNYPADSKMVVFAYIDEIDLDVHTSIDLNDLIQIVMDCSLGMADKSDRLIRSWTVNNVTRLGWTVSYVLQRLWHDNPSNSKTVENLKYKSSRDLKDYEYSMKGINLPKIELKKLEFEVNPEEEPEDKIQFYVELGWKDFYDHFPIMQKSDLLKFAAAEEYRVKRGEDEFVVIGNVNKYFSQNLKKMFKEFIEEDLKNDLSILSSGEKKTKLEFGNLWLNKTLIKKGQTKNKDIFTFNYNKIDNNWQLIKDSHPHEMGKAVMQNGFGMTDREFLWSMLSVNASENISLYAVTGKFSIFYTISKIEIVKEEDGIYCYFKELLAHVFDTFDFDDSSDQHVGSWDYMNLEFNAIKSGMENFVGVPKFSHHYMYNRDYQTYKDKFKKGLNFRVFSKEFLVLSVPQDKNSRLLFRVKLDV